MLWVRKGVWCSVRVIQRYLEIRGITRLANDVSAMGCVFGEE